jgi:archaeoflavoprotein AfpA
LRDKRLPLKIVWGLTGSGDLITETFEAMKALSENKDLKITILLSKAALKVVKWYGLWDKIQTMSEKIFIEEDANTPFIQGPLQTGKYKFLLIAPATANTVAKIVNGIADTLITNAVAQTNKGTTDIFILPVDQRKGKTTTILPSGEKLELNMRDVDIENTDKLRGMKGIQVLEKPQEIKSIINKYIE